MFPSLRREGSRVQLTLHLAEAQYSATVARIADFLFALLRLTLNPSFFQALPALVAVPMNRYTGLVVFVLGRCVQWFACQELHIAERTFAIGDRDR